MIGTYQKDTKANFKGINSGQISGNVSKKWIILVKDFNPCGKTRKYEYLWIETNNWINKSREKRNFFIQFSLK